MADATTDGGQEQKDPQTPVFDDAQKSHITKLIEERVNRLAAKHEADKAAAVAAAKAEKDAELAAEREKAKGKGASDPDKEAAEKEQYKHILEAEKQRTAAAAARAADLEKQVKEVETTNHKILKDAAIRDAVDGQDTFKFHDLSVVRTLTEKQVFFDKETGTYQVKDENGVVMQNSSLQPMSLKEFFASFAASHPYLVSSQTKSGTGAGDSNRTAAGGLAKVTSKADLKTFKEKNDYINKFGGDAFEKLPLR